MSTHRPDTFYATTVVSVRRNGKVVVGGDGQVTLGNTIMKSNAKKVRRLGKGDVLAGFAGATADAFTLFELFEAKLEKHGGQLTRAAVEMAKEWRTERRFGRLEALLAVADKTTSLLISGTGDVLEPEHGLIAIGSGEKARIITCPNSLFCVGIYKLVCIFRTNGQRNIFRAKKPSLVSATKV